MAGPTAPSQEVFDVHHIAGRVMNEKGHRVVPLLLSGSGYVPRCTSAERVILTGHIKATECHQ